MKTRNWLILFVFLLATIANSQEQRKESLPDLISEALRQNPEIAVEQSRIKMMQERIPQAGALADPEFNFKQMNFHGLRFSEAMFQNYELMQMIMFPTKLTTQKEIASVAANSAHWGYTSKTIDIVARLKSAYAMLWDARTRLSINLENQQILEQILRVAQTRYSVGQTSQQDVLKTSIELASEKTTEAVIHQEIVKAESMLRALLNRPNHISIGTVEMDSIRTLNLSNVRLLNYAKRNHPMLVQDSLNVVNGKLMTSMARQEYLPDFRISIERATQPMIGLKSWSIMAGISLPFAPWTLSKASARVEEAKADYQMRQSMLIADINMIEAGIQDAYAKVQAYEKQVRTFNLIILPQSKQSLEASLAEYQSGHTPYIMLLDAYRMNQMMRMEAVMARMKYEDALAQLQRQVGVHDFNEILIKEGR